MHKTFTMAVLYSIMLFLFPFTKGYCAEQDPEKFLTEFYTWYIPAQSQMYPEYHRNIYLYVARETVEELKKRPSGSGYDGTDYFLKINDTPTDMNGVSILVNKTEALGPDTFVSTVTIVYVDKFGHRLPDGLIVVVLKKIQGKLKIFKCSDSYPEA